MVVVPGVAMDWIVGLVNEYARAAREAAGEQALPYPDLKLPAPPGGQPPLVDRTQLVQLADELHAVFAAAHRGPSCAEAINTMLGRTRPWPQVGPHGTIWIIDSADTGGEPLAAGAAIALLHFVEQYGQERLGLCAAERCVDVYADASPGGRRRFCSAVCLNRHKVAAHRSRRRIKVFSDGSTGAPPNQTFGPPTASP